MKKILFLLLPVAMFAQPKNYWQQHVDYTMEIDFNTKKHQFSGTQELQYTNNSPDTLYEVFYHLYFNAFQPGSMMDVRSQNIADPDKRVGDRIGNMVKGEEGYHQIKSLLQDGDALDYAVSQTILSATLNKPLAPGKSTKLNMEFSSQVPIQIRRSGRNNAEGIDYTMTQWYPKMAEYDEDGWHPDPYVGREFYAPFGRFDVTINIASDQVLGGTGRLLNRNKRFKVKKQFEHFTEYELVKNKDKKQTWHFVADSVHDFAWAADPDYKLTALEKQGALPNLYFYYLSDYDTTWSKLPKYTSSFFSLMNAQFGQYLYPQFSVIQGGDGGMEYPMCTMLKGTGKLNGLVGVMVHESAHNWYYGMLASNENQYPWMDEGFTSFAEEEILHKMKGSTEKNAHKRAYLNYVYLAKNGEMEPLATSADYFTKNRTYGISAYSRGEIFLSQLRYIIGEEAFNRGILSYYDQWKLKHPDPWDFIKVMEDESDIQLDWYLNFWLNTNKHADYAIDTVYGDTRGMQSIIRLRQKGERPMPLRISIYDNTGTKAEYYIPVASMFGFPDEFDTQIQQPWPWTHPTYELRLKMNKGTIRKIVIDEAGFMGDIDRTNNSWLAEEEKLPK
jgi:hypothetical protein